MKILKNIFFSIKHINLSFNGSRPICNQSMAETLENLRKQRYDGRSKKRKWEDRRLDCGDIKRERMEPFERVKRRKYALLLGYSGDNYYGMQRNPFKLTIEEEIFKSFLACKFISEQEFTQVQTIQFQRAARTDKGVSAARQVISLKLPENINIGSVNENLPETIRIFGIRRVTKGFNSKSQCDARTYSYLLPTVAFSERGEEIKQEDFALKSEIFTNVNEVLSNFVGTKNFHNYTCKKKFNDPSASRYIMSFVCEKPFVTQNTEFAVLKVKGQSFMMHQIRKMIGLTLAVIKGYTTIETLHKSFTIDKVNVPRVPGLGLLLEFVHYDRYNVRYGSTHDKLEWNEENEAAENFKQKYIYPNIIDKEIKDQEMVKWMEVLDFHNFDIPEIEDVDDFIQNGDDDDDDDLIEAKGFVEKDSEVKVEDSSVKSNSI